MSAEIALINMPFFSLYLPSLGLSLLKAEIDRVGYSADIHYLNLSFASVIGYDLYHQIEDPPRGRLALEWVFVESLWGDTRDSDEKFIKRFKEEEGKEEDGNFAEQFIHRLMDCRGKVERFFEQTLNAISWGNYKVIGFSSMFQQHLASLSLARKLKYAFPDTFIIFGGANCEGIMGTALLNSFPFIDAVCSGEGDIAFPSLIQQLLGGGKPKYISGILRRGAVARAGKKNSLPIYAVANAQSSNLSMNAADCSNSGAAPQNSYRTALSDQVSTQVLCLDELPYPEFSDYFEQVSKYEYKAPPSVWTRLPFETSRGCWWGERHHCTFCGLNGEIMTFRSKSPRRAVDELKYLAGRHGKEVSYFAASDNIMPMTYFKEVLPSLGELGVPVFYETKANLREEHVALLKQGNVKWIQPGIESLSTPVLRLMRKGVTAIQNLQLMKFCIQYGIIPSWNFLLGFPGETSADYEGTPDLIRAIPHFTPPYGISRVRFDRFSPYLYDSENLGVRDLSPAYTYRYLFPNFDEKTISNLAYFFTGTFDGQDRIVEYESEISKAVKEWKQIHLESALFEIDFDDFMVVCDFRPGKTEHFTMFQAPWNSVYREFQKICSLKRARSLVDTISGVTPGELETFLSYLHSEQLIWCEKQEILSLSIPCGYAYQAPQRYVESLMAEINSIT